jgi:hypothetical protein
MVRQVDRLLTGSQHVQDGCILTGKIIHELIACFFKLLARPLNTSLDALDLVYNDVIHTG